MPKAKRKITRFRPKIRSRHPSHRPLREKDIWSGRRLPFKSVIRLGSTTSLPDDASKGGDRVELNTVQAIQNCSNKLRMKQLFVKSKVLTPAFVLGKDLKVDNPPFELPIVMKRNNHSRGRGMVRVTSVEEYNDFLTQHKAELGNYHAEQYFASGREYRIHVSVWMEEEIFAVRKVLTAEAKAEGRWNRNLEEGKVFFQEEFDRPPIWNDMVAESIKAVRSLELDFGAVDVMYSVKKNAFTVCEVNSAPSMGDHTLEAYVDAFVKSLTKKHASR